MSWNLAQRRGKQGRVKAEMAAEILKSLFSHNGGSRKANQGESEEHREVLAEADDQVHA